MMLKSRSAFAVVTAATLLAGCSGPRVAPNTERDTYLAELYQYGAGGRDLALEVRGNPFTPADKPALDAVVEKALAGIGMLQPPTRPRLSPGPEARSNYRMVVQFMRGATLDGQDLCNNAKAPPMSQGQGEVTAVMAFCVSGRAASQSVGWYAPSGIDDPGLAELLKRLEVELFRPDDTVQGSGTQQ